MNTLLFLFVNGAFWQVWSARSTQGGLEIYYLIMVVVEQELTSLGLLTVTAVSTLLPAAWS